MKLFYQYMAIFFNWSPTSNHFHPLQVENCNSNSRLVVNEDDNGKFRLERVKFKDWLMLVWTMFCYVMIVRRSHPGEYQAEGVLLLGRILQAGRPVCF